MPDLPSVQREHHEGVLIVRLREPASGSEVEVVPDVGSNLHRFRTRLGDRAVDVLAAAPDLATLRERPTRFGSAPLFPYPGRIAGGRFPFRGREIVLPTQPDGNAIHGVVRARPWRVLETDATAETGARVMTQISTAAEQIPAEEWPWPFSFTLTTTLRHGTVRVEAEALNEGDQAMPIGLGFHPYFPTPLGPGGSPGECEVWVDATELWEQAPPGLPTGQVEPLGPEEGLRRPTRLADVPERMPMPGGTARNLLFRRETSGASDAPGGIRAGLRDPHNRVEIVLSASAGFGALVFFTPPSPPVVSLEPHTCLPNAFNLDPRGLPAGTVALEPGQRWRGWYQIEARAL